MLALTSISFFMVALDALVVVTALPEIHRSLGGSITTLEWAVNAYTLTFAAGIITAAAIGDRLGRRRVYVAGLVLFTVASAACALAPNSASLIAARAVQGLGAAAVTPLALTILASTFPPERRGAVVGIFGGIGGLAVAGGPLVGGVVVQGLDWHWIFWINVPIGLAAALGVGAVPAVRPRTGGAAGPARGAAGGGRRGGDRVGPGPGRRRRLERRGSPRRRSPRGSRCSRRSCCASGGQPSRCCRCGCSASGRSPRPTSPGSSRPARSSPRRSSPRSTSSSASGYSPLATGLRLLPWTATPMVVAPLAGALADRIGARPLLVAGLVMQAAGLAWVASLATTAAGGGYGRFVVPLIIAGVGVSMTLPTVPTAALGAVPPGDVGRASGVNNTLQRFGSAFGIALVSAVFAANGHFGSVASFTAGYRPAMAVSAAISLLGAVAATAVGRRRAAAVARPAAPAPADLPAAANLAADAS